MKMISKPSLENVVNLGFNIAKGGSIAVGLAGGAVLAYTIPELYHNSKELGSAIFTGEFNQSEKFTWNLYLDVVVAVPSMMLGWIGFETFNDIHKKYNNRNTNIYY